MKTRAEAGSARIGPPEERPATRSLPIARRPFVAKGPGCRGSERAGGRSLKSWPAPARPRCRIGTTAHGPPLSGDRHARREVDERSDS